MVVHQHLILSLISFILFIVLLHKCLSGTLFRTRKNVPPSPRKLPIIGNLHQLGTSPHRSLQALSKLYGQLFLLHFGRVRVLVASSAQAAREIMKKQDVIFSNRPKSSIADRLIYGSKDVAFAPYGEYWRQVRNISVVHLLANKRVQSYSLVREEETSTMVEKIKRLGSSTLVVNLSEILVSLTNNVVCRVALGRKYGEDKIFSKLLGEFVELLGAGVSYGDYIPCLGWIIDRVNGLDAKAERVAKEFDEFFEDVIEEHREGKRDTSSSINGEKDFVDILLEFQKENQSVEDDTIKAIIMDMFSAGTEPTAVTLEWGIAELIKNPRTMKMLQNQVRQVVGTQKEFIDEDDIEKMPYLKAVIKETLRLHPPVTLLVPRESTQDTAVMGYDISAGTQVIINAWAIGRDPCLWENPEEFRPERFLDSEVDYKGLHFELIPFGAGRRGCPGIAFAEAVVELGLAKLVQCFNFAVREEDLDMSEISGLTVRKKQPLLVVVTSP